MSTLARENPHSADSPLMTLGPHIFQQAAARDRNSIFQRVGPSRSLPEAISAVSSPVRVSPSRTARSSPAPGDGNPQRSSGRSGRRLGRGSIRACRWWRGNAPSLPRRRQTACDRGDGDLSRSARHQGRTRRYRGPLLSSVAVTSDFLGKHRHAWFAVAIPRRVELSSPLDDQGEARINVRPPRHQPDRLEQR
jgi:hypothetical protein